MTLIEIEDLPALNDPVVIAAFEGWNDAGEAATGALTHLAQSWETRDVAALDPEDYYDFQVTRPTVATVDGERVISWPSARFAVARGALDGRDVVLVTGPEPSFRWPTFVEEIVTFAENCGASMFVTVGALLADSPHTRPIPVFMSSEDGELVEHLNLSPSTYEGPTGIVGVLASAATTYGLPAISVWASVPHYAASSPSPKATLALVAALEKLLGSDLPRGELEEMSRAWEHGVNELATSDPEIAEYVKALESAKDTVDSPEASGDAIAREFERYLRRRDDR